MIVNEGIGGGKKLPTLSNPGAASNLLSGKQLLNQNGEIVTGTMTNRGNVTQSLNAGGSYTIPSGYHAGGGKITANSLSSQTSATATAADIRSGKTAWVNGSRITGTGQMAQKTSFGFLCHGTYDRIRIYTDVRYANSSNRDDEYYEVPAGDRSAHTFECTMGSIIVVHYYDGFHDYGRDNADLVMLSSWGGNDPGESMTEVYYCNGENGIIEVETD